jgi:hypothetical protein
MMDYLPYLAVVAAWGSGFLFCRFTHRQRGLEVDDLRIVMPSPEPAGADR